jgi:UDP-glucose 4-epimerase
MTTCLITGGAGFIGSHLAEQLVARHHTVRVLDNLTGGTLANLDRVLPAIDFHLGDVTDPDLVQKVIQGVDFVFHLAAAREPFDVLAHPQSASSPDVIGIHQVLNAARTSRVRRLIYASSLRVYGATDGDLCQEGRALQPSRALTPEGIAKALGEKACVECTRDCGLETVCLRFFHVFGPRQPRGNPYAQVIEKALDAALAGHSPVLDGDGSIAQDLIAVGDAVYANLTALDAPRVSGKAYNIGRGLPTTGLDVVAALNATLATHIEPTFTVARPLIDLDNRADISRAEAELGYCPGEDLKRGLRLCVEDRVRRTGPPHLGRFAVARKPLPTNK